MAARAIGSGTISFGLVSIPVKLYPAASPQTVRFNQLHAECGSRVRQKMYCPVCDRDVERGELVKGYEYAKNQYVQFTDEELKALEAEKTNTLDVVEFVPLDTVDLVQVEKSYYLGPDKGGAKAYKLFSDAMEHSGKVAVGRYWTRGKEQLVILRPYREGLLLHYVYYADEVRAFSELDLGGEVKYKENELQLAEQLIEQLSSDRFEPEQYRDEWRERVLHAVEEKVSGEEITTAPEQPAAQVIDLFEALKESVSQGKKGPKKAEPEAASSSKKTAANKGGANKAGPKKAGPKKAEPKKAGQRKGASSKSASGGTASDAEASKADGAQSGASIKPPRKASSRKSGGGQKKKRSTGSEG